MRLWLAILLGTALAAQTSPPVAIVSGSVLSWDAEGSVRLRSRDLQILDCTFDSEIYIDRAGNRINASEVHSGWLVDAVLDRQEESSSCRVLTMYVRRAVDEEVSRRYKELLNRQRHLLDHLSPRGQYEISGIVLEAGDSVLVLRTRDDGLKTIRLRDDTRYTYDGLPGGTEILEPNAVVFVQAGDGLDGRLEAYQVVRGSILTTR